MSACGVRLYALLALLGYVLLVPYYDAPLAGWPAGWPAPVVKYLPFGLCLVVLALSLPAARSTTWHALTADTALRAIAAYVVVQGLSLVDATLPLFGLQKWIYYSVTGPLLYLAVRTVDDAGLARITQVLAIAGACAAGAGLLDWGLAGGHHLRGILGHHSVTGTCLLAVAPLVWSAGGRGYRATAGLLAGTLLLTFSRGAWIAALVAGALLGRRRLVGGGRRLRLAALFLGLLTAGAALDDGGLARVTLRPVLADSGLLAGLERAWEKTIHFERVDAHRLEQWQTTARILHTDPVLGLGFGQFTSLFDDVSDPVGPQRTARTTDNMYPTAASETGLLGLGAFVSLVLVLGRRVWAARRLGDGLGEGVLAAFGGLLVVMLFWDTLNHPTLRILFWTIAGMGAALVVRQEEPT